MSPRHQPGETTAASRPAPAPLLLLISAPSGAGKTTVCQRLLESTPGLCRAITCTTRPPRSGERDGVDYHFLTPVEFATRLEAGEFLEHATVYGNHYGTLETEVSNHLREGHDVLLTIDVQGAEAVRRRARIDAELGRSLVTVFLVTPTLAELRRRLAKRDKDAPDVIARRLSEARRELAEAPKFEYLVVSGSIEEDLRRMRTIYEAEKMRAGRARVPAAVWAGGEP